MDNDHDGHFARIVPVVGAHLRERRVAVVGLAAGAPLVAYLAACGVRRWLWHDEDRRPTTATRPLTAAGTPAESLRAQLLAQHGAALGLDAQAAMGATWHAAVLRFAPDLVLGVGGAAELRCALGTARQTNAPALLVALPDAAQPGAALCVFPGEHDAAIAFIAGIAGQRIARSKKGKPPRSPRTPRKRCLPLRSRGPRWLHRSTLGNSLCTSAHWQWQTAAPLCAGLARALLLHDTPCRRADLAALWDSGARRFTFGTPADPFDAQAHPLPRAPTRARTRAPAHPFTTPPARRGTLLIVGLGSLGSVAAVQLAAHAARMVIADHDRVDAHNPVRQAYPVATIGQPKAAALRAVLRAAGAAEVRALDAALDDERAVETLIAAHSITAALVVTGTDADFAIARALRAHGVPHIVGRCYPRARFWEAIIVDGQRGAAFDELRGHLRAGPLPAPTPEQRAAYSDLGALEAEPATLVESGWAAAWLARLTAQMLAPPGLRERWLLGLLAAGQTCIIGGVGVEPTPDGPAYAIAAPGAVRAWGREMIRHTDAGGDEATRRNQ